MLCSEYLLPLEQMRRNIASSASGKPSSRDGEALVSGISALLPPGGARHGPGDEQLPPTPSSSPRTVLTVTVLFLVYN